jgi:hypothetical protein
MTTLVKCGICEGLHAEHREHCPYCGARRVFIASHSYEPYRVLVAARSNEDMSREVVRAYQTNIAHSFIVR